MIWRIVLTLLTVAAMPCRAAAQVAETPTYKIGDEWRYERTTVRVVGVEPGQYTFVVTGSPTCEECQYTWDSNRTLIKVASKEGKPVEDTAAGLKLMQFPMSVGVTWTANQILRQRNTPDLIPYNNTFTVAAYEDVKTKAGTFKAYKVVWEQENKAIYRNWKGRLLRWYSPEVKNWVKQEVFTARWREDFELQSYSLK